MKRKYFFFDIDGTLLTAQYSAIICPESTKEALKQLKANGHFIAIATGRSQARAEEVRKMLEIENMVSDGGNGITLNNQLIEIEPLDYDCCLALIDECKKKNFIWALSFDNSPIRYAPDERFYAVTQDTYMETKIIENLDPRNYSEIYKIYIACLDQEEKALESLNALPWCRFHPEYLFVEPCDKAKGIKKMLHMVGGKEEDVVVFGDQKNDLSMFSDEWTSIAMGNAVDELKAKASYITDDVDKDGIWKACKHFGWI